MFLYLILGMMALAIMYPHVSFGVQDSQEKYTSEIIITKGKNTYPIHPRSVDQIAISCIYNGVSESLQFNFLKDLGNVTITIINTMTGQTFYGMCSSTPDTCNVDIIGEEGQYTIQIEDEQGCVYIGSFSL